MSPLRNPLHLIYLMVIFCMLGGLAVAHALPPQTGRFLSAALVFFAAGLACGTIIHLFVALRKLKSLRIPPVSDSKAYAEFVRAREIQNAEGPAQMIEANVALSALAWVVLLVALLLTKQNGLGVPPIARINAPLYFLGIGLLAAGPIMWTGDKLKRRYVAKLCAENAKRRKEQTKGDIR